MNWRLILKEFGPELKYIKSENNVVADALSCLEMSDNQDILLPILLQGSNADSASISWMIEHIVIPI